MIYIITGHYGSGKTEIAINMAKTLDKPKVVDLDIVNPYFRTKDAKEFLKSHGATLVAPEFANTNIDIPSLPPEIIGAIQGDGDIIIDVGGDDDGAIALGQYNRHIINKDYDMVFVINTKRPETSDAEGIISMIRRIEYASRLKVTSLINNTNLKNETTVNDVLQGQVIVDEVSKITGLPIKAISAKADIINQINLDYPKMELNLNLILPWEV